MALLLPDLQPHFRAAGKCITFTSSPLCCSLWFVLLVKIPVWMQIPFAPPSSLPTVLTTTVWGQFLEMVECAPVSRRSFHSWFVVEVGQTGRSTSGWVSLWYNVLMFKLLSQTLHTYTPWKIISALGMVFPNTTNAVQLCNFEFFFHIQAYFFYKSKHVSVFFLYKYKHK